MLDRPSARRVRGAAAARALALALALLALLAAPPAATAREAGAGERPSAAAVAGFASLPWGADRQQVLAARGEPAGAARPQPDVVAYAYDEQLLGRSATTTFVVADALGMIKGLHRLPLAAGEDCLGWHARLVELVRARHPGAEPTFDERVNAGWKPFCEAVRRGEAGALTSFRGPQGTEIHVALPPGSGALHLVYETPAFGELAARRGALAGRAAAPGR